MSTRVLILAAGDGSRWNNHMGIPKHKVVINGETLIERTTRQFLKYVNDVVVVGSDSSYKVSGASLYIPKQYEKYMDMGKFLSSSKLWSKDKTILVFGDVYFTDQAIETIVLNQSEWCFYLREGASKVKPYGEIFGLSFNFSFNKYILGTMNKIISTQNVKTSAGWVLLKTLLNVEEQSKIFVSKNISKYINIDDLTEDFDSGGEYDAWMANYQSIVLDLPAKV